jgi:hypothetical protein
MSTSYNTVNGGGNNTNTSETCHSISQEAKPSAALSPEPEQLLQLSIGQVYTVDVGHRLALTTHNQHTSIREATCMDHLYQTKHLLPLASGLLVWLPPADEQHRCSCIERLLPIHLLRAPASIPISSAMHQLMTRYQALTHIHAIPDAAWNLFPIHIRILKRLMRRFRFQTWSSAQ